MLQRLLVRAPQVKARSSVLPEHSRVKTSPVSLPHMGRPAMVTQTQEPIEPETWVNQTTEGSSHHRRGSHLQAKAEL